jgi:hypothetical protein
MIESNIFQTDREHKANWVSLNHYIERSEVTGDWYARKINLFLIHKLWSRSERFSFRYFKNWIWTRKYNK